MTVEGTIDRDANGETIVRATSFPSKTSGGQLGALGMTNKTLNASQGLDPSGLLVRVCVTFRAPDGSYAVSVKPSPPCLSSVPERYYLKS